MSQMNSGASTAEAQFRAAFERLKGGSTLNLPAGSAVSQNNVAKEAGRDPSALRKARYPELVREIQSWLSSSDPPSRSHTSALEAARANTRRVRSSKEVLKVQFDSLASELLAAHALILELTQENGRLRSQLGLDNVRPLLPRKA